MLVEEFKRCDVTFSMEGRRVVDVMNIFHKEEPRRDLSAAARFYLGREHEDAHEALSDIRLSAEVLGAQFELYSHLPRSMDGLHSYCASTEVDRWFSPEEEGRVFRRGKYQGRPLQEVAAEAPDYLHWMIGAKDMDQGVIKVVREALEPS